MDLEERAEKLENIRWRADHNSFISSCPVDPKHTLAVSRTKFKCLGGCADDLIANFFANGTGKGGDALDRYEPKHRATVSPDNKRPAAVTSVGGPAQSNGTGPRPLTSQEIQTRPSELDQWKTHLWITMNGIQRDDPTFFRHGHAGAVVSLGATIDSTPYLQPPADLSHSEAEEEIDRLVALFIKEEVPQVPAVKIAEQLPLLLPDLTKSTVEVFEWGQMRTRRASHVRDWVSEGMLARRETSSWSGKVEAGKTTLMRELTMAVIRGEPFLGRPTVKGRVVYAMLDADGEDVTYDEFAKLGFNDADAEWCRFLFEPMMAQIEKGLEQFIKILQDFKPSLVIIDPYPRLKMIEDFHSYTNTYLMGMLSWMATTLDAHLALPGHIPRGRGDDDEVATAGFGSISFSGGVNARFVVTNRNGIHTIRSSKGKAAGFVPLEAEYVLQRDAETGRIAMGDPFSWKDKGRAAADPVASFLAANNERCFDLAGLAREIHLQKSVVRTALGSLVYEGRIKREGEGLKKSPYIYSSLTFAGPLTLAEATRE